MQRPTIQIAGSHLWPGPGALTTGFGEDAQSQARLQAAVTAGGTAAFHTDLVTRERWWSPEMFSVHGLAGSEEVPPDYMALVHPEDRRVVEAAFQQSLVEGAHHVQYRVQWPDGSIHWLEGVGRATHDREGHPLAISGVCTLIDSRRREEADLRFLAEASVAFARSTDYEETLRRVAELAVPHFADWCAVDMVDEQGGLKRLAVAHVDPAKVGLAEELHRRYPPSPELPVGVWQVLRTGQPELVAEITPELLERSARDAEHLAIARALGLRSYMGVPIVAASGVLGVITFVSSDSGRVYGQRDLELATDLVSRASVAIQNASMFRALRRSDARQSFLLRLTDVLRRPCALPEVLTAVSEMLGRHFGVDRVGYGHVDERLDRIEYDVCWTDGTVPPLRGVFPASAFGQPVIERLRAGHTIAIADVRDHPLTSDEGTLKTSHEVETRAILVVPLFKAGRLRTIVYLNQSPARQWSADEISLMEEVAERTRELIERVRTEEALRESEARWRGLFERMAEGFFVAEAIRDATGRMVDFRFLEVNPAFERLTDVSMTSALARSVREVIPGVQPELIDRYARVVDSGEPAEFEVLIPALNDRWYEARARSVGRDQFSVLFLEITARKVAQLEQARSAQRYRTLFESIDEGFCILEVLFDASGRPGDYRFLEVNPAFERQSGLVNAVGRTIRELVPVIEDVYIDTYARVARTGESVRFESHALAMHRWFDAFAFRIGEPESWRVALLFTDITERRSAQEAVEDRERELSEAQRLAAIGSWFWDVAEDRTDSSPELLRIFGFPEGARLPGFAAQRGTMYREEDWDRLNAAVQSALASGVPYSVDLRAFRDGRPIWVTARGTPVRDLQGGIVALRGTVQDITERKQIEEALREADIRKDEFLATLAHELRNPLAPLRNALAILRGADGHGAAAVRARELMERQLAHLVRLVDDLLDVSRVSQGKVAMKKNVTSLQSVVDVALETARPLMDAAGHTLKVQLPHEPVLLHVDPTRIAQVLANLLNNAAKYTPRDGQIVLSARLLEPARLELRVQDNGVGIPADMLEKVFDLFTQVGGALERSQGGLGIGLSLARRLVELHGGSLRATSAGERQGSTFVVELPLPEQRQEPMGPRQDGAGAAPAAAARRVLVVDDNTDAAETLGLLLELQGHQVQVVHTGGRALEAASRGKPDIVFLDIGLPDLNGYEVAERLRAHPELKETWLVALTGWGTERDQQRARAAGIDLHLTKPVSAEDLANAVAGARVKAGT
jgi:PAS domain S-box-containing protein